MKYYYFPSTYFGFRGRGYAGSGSNAGYLVGCGLGGNIEEVTQIDPQKILENGSFLDQAAMTKMEGKDGPTQVSKKRFDFWKWLGDGKEAVSELFSNGYSALKRRLNNLNQWRIKKQGDLWARVKRSNFWKKISGIGNFFKNIKIRTVASVQGLWRRFKDYMRKIGINIYAYGKATLIVLRDTFYEAIGKGLGFAKSFAKSGLVLTDAILDSIASKLGKLGWKPMEIVSAIAFLIHPPSIGERMLGKLIDTIPGITSGLVKGATAASGVGLLTGAVQGAKAIAGKGLGYGGAGVFNMGVGYGGVRVRKRRSKRFVKGSPEAKAYMAYLRSLRRS